MKPALSPDASKAIRLFVATHLLSFLLLGVAAVAALCAYVFDDPGIAYGVLIIGGMTAFLESGHHGRGKP